MKFKRINEETREERAYLRKNHARKRQARKYAYKMYASGYGSKTYAFDSQKEALDEMKMDAQCTADEYGGEVQWYDDKEATVVDGDGQEVARFELMFESTSDAMNPYQAERKRVKDKIYEIVGSDYADDVFEYWDRIQSSFNTSFEYDGFRGSVEKHLARLANILGPAGKDIIDDIEAKFKRQEKELMDYYDTHDYTGD